MAGIGRAAMLTGAAAGIADARRIMLEDEGIRNQREDRKQVGVDRTQQRADQQHNRERQTVTEGRQDQDYERQEKDRKYNDDFKKVVRIAGMSKNLNPAVDLVNSQLPEGMKVEIKQDVDDKGSFRYKKIIDIDGQKKEEDWKDFDTVMTELMMASDPTIFEKIRSERASAATKASDRKAKQADAIALQNVKNKGGVDKENAKAANGGGKAESDYYKNPLSVEKEVTGRIISANNGSLTPGGEWMLKPGTEDVVSWGVANGSALSLKQKDKGGQFLSAGELADITVQAQKMLAYDKKTKKITPESKKSAKAESERLYKEAITAKGGSGVNPQAGNTPQDVEAAKKDPNIMYKYLKDKYSGNATDEEIIAKIQEVFGNSSWTPNQVLSQTGITR